MSQAEFASRNKSAARKWEDRLRRGLPTKPSWNIVRLHIEQRPHGGLRILQVYGSTHKTRAGRLFNMRMRIKRFLA